MPLVNPDSYCAPGFIAHSHRLPGAGREETRGPAGIRIQGWDELRLVWEPTQGTGDRTTKCNAGSLQGAASNRRLETEPAAVCRQQASPPDAEGLALPLGDPSVPLGHGDNPITGFYVEA